MYRFAPQYRPTRHYRIVAASLLALLLTLAGIAGAASPSTTDDDTIYQLSTIDALLSGLYDGVAPVDLAHRHGDFGLGTFDGLDGEMIVLDGEIYQAAFDGSLNRVASDVTTPFMVVTHFDADRTFAAPDGTSYPDLKDWLADRLPSPNLFYAIRIDGSFRDMRVRSVPRQTHKPYPPLAEVARHQAVFERPEVTGTVLGFWCPGYSKGINVPGFHLHFLSDDRRYGGHVLTFTVADATVQLDPSRSWLVELPGDAAFAATDLARDRSRALQRVESDHGDAAPAEPR